MNFLTKSLWFPEVTEASEEGLLAIGGDLSAERLLLAYQNGIFPWYEEGQPILWWSPDPRMILIPEDLKVSKSLWKTIQSQRFEVTFNTAFREVIHNCSQINRPGQSDTWITPEMKKAYIELHKRGQAISVEVWQEGELVGGLYGIDLPKQAIFCGESMFSHKSDASKVGFFYLVSELKKKEYKLIDCQVYTSHLKRFGAQEIPRTKFLEYLYS